jgi:hypothetical protein
MVVTATVPAVGIGTGTTTTTTATSPTPTAPPSSAIAVPLGPLTGAVPLAQAPATIARPSPLPAAVVKVARPVAATRADAARTLSPRAIDEVREGRADRDPSWSTWPDARLLDDLIADPVVRRALDEAPPSQTPIGAGPTVGERREPVVSSGWPGSVPAGPLPHRRSTRRMAGPAELLLALGLCGPAIGLPAARRLAEARRRPVRPITDGADGSRPLPRPPRTV